MKAWVVKEWRDEAGKIKRKVMAPGVKDVRPNDVFVVEWFEGTKRRRKKVRTLPDDSRATNAKASKREADKLAREKCVAIENGTHRPASTESWQQFRQRYDEEVLGSLAEATGRKVRTVFDKLESVINPGRLTDLTPARLSYFQSKLAAELQPQTVKSYLAHLAAALQWAVDIGELPAMPFIKKPENAKGQKLMKGRPITAEEHDRLLAAVPKIVGHEAAESWRYYLTGLWLSGLRLSESLDLWWDRDDRLSVDLSGEFPMLRIPAAMEKGGKDRILPMAPEFAEFLLATPDAQRVGRVFRPAARRVCSEQLCHYQVSRLVVAIGKAACVVVDKAKGKCASAHDLRRSFGERWAARVMPAVLMELMRHESIETTMRFYVGRNAQRTAAVLWEAHNRAGVSPESCGAPCGASNSAPSSIPNQSPQLRSRQEAEK